MPIHQIIIKTTSDKLISLAYYAHKRGTRINVTISASTGRYWFRYGNENTQGGHQHAHKRICNDIGYLGPVPSSPFGMLCLLSDCVWPGRKIIERTPKETNNG